MLTRTDLEPKTHKLHCPGCISLVVTGEPEPTNPQVVHFRCTCGYKMVVHYDERGEMVAGWRE